MTEADAEHEAALEEFLAKVRGTLELSEAVLVEHLAKDAKAAEMVATARAEIQESYAMLDRVEAILKRHR